MEPQWHEIEPGTYEARVGAWLFEVGRNDEAKPWRVWVGLMPESGDAASAVFFRRDVAGSLEDAQRVAIELAKEKSSPLAATTHAVRCTWCDAPAVCIATSEGDPYMFACGEHCGHGDEEGAHAFLSEPAAMLAIINGLHARVAELEESDGRDRAEEREACADIAQTLADSAYEMGESDLRAAPQRIASAIRARSNGGVRADETKDATR